MTNKQLIATLAKHRDAPEFGGVVAVGHTESAWVRLASDIGLEPSMATGGYSLRDYLSYLSWKASHAWMRPVSVAFAAFALVFGGWVTSVNASFDTVPGDVLYPVKLVTERMQITLATSGEQRVKLHAEFAGRRIDEMNDIATSDRAGKDVRVRAAMDGFEQEIASVNIELAAVASENPGDAAALAIIVDQRTDAYMAAISQSATDVPEESQTRVADAFTAAEATNAQAIEAIVQSHETSQQPQTGESLQKNFQERLRDIDTRVALSLGRISVIESALRARGSASGPSAARLDAAREALSSYRDAIQEATDKFAAGGYRTAFELLGSVEADVSASEVIVAELEIELTAGL